MGNDVTRDLDAKLSQPSFSILRCLDLVAP
jgi:hypothetical protein